MSSRSAQAVALASNRSRRARQWSTVLAAAVVLAVASAHVLANDNSPIWIGAALDNNWSDPDNWFVRNSVDNGGDDHVSIGGNPARKTTTLDVGYTIDSLTFTKKDNAYSNPTATSFLVNGTGWLGINSAITNESSYDNSVTAPIQFNGNPYFGTFTVSNSGDNIGSLNLDRVYLHGTPVTFQPGAKGITINSEISGGETGSQVICDGAGTLTLKGSNTWFGGLSINSGTVEYASGPNLGSLGNPITIEPNSGQCTLRRTATGTAIANISIGFGESRFEAPLGVAATYTGTIKGVGDFAKTGLGTVVLSGALQNSGSVYVRAGTLSMEGTAFLPNGALHVESDATLAYADGKNDTAGQLYGGGSIVLHANNRLQVGYRTASSGAGLWSGNITGAGAQFTKGGAGTLEFTSPQDYGGLTTVEAGTFVVNNTTGSATGTGAVSVLNTATMRGHGSVSGVITVANGGTLAVSANDGTDTTLGTLKVGGLSLASGSTTRVVVKSVGTTSVTDHLTVTGAADFSAGTLQLSRLAGFDPSAAGASTPREFIHVNGAITGHFATISGGKISSTQYFATSYGAHSVSLAIAKPGDATLDCVVNFDDLIVLAQNYNATTGKTWTGGDFNGDGAVNFDDLIPLAQNYTSSGAAAGSLAAREAFAADWALAQSLVPEPSSTAMICSVTVLAYRRRRAVL